MSKLLYTCSSNPGKLREFILAARQYRPSDYSIEVLPGVAQIAVPEETGTTFEENAAEKAAYYSTFTPELVFADDSGLEVDALMGAPGVLSARYAGASPSALDNNRLLLHNLTGNIDRSARFVCVIAVAREGRVLHTFRATVAGTVLEAPVGNNGFGYDPLFFYPRYGCSFGELSDEEKLAVSARGQAFRALLAWLEKPLAFC